MQYKRGQFVGNHGLSYTITNLTMVAIWRSNGFRIHPLIAEKKTTLLFQGTFGHTVCDGEVASTLSLFLAGTRQREGGYFRVAINGFYAHFNLTHFDIGQLA